MIQLATFQVGLPIVFHRVVVTHTTPRALTAFERMILLLSDRFGKDETYGSISLVRVFEDFLRVGDPAPLLSPVLQELVALDAINISVDFTRPDEVLLNHLTLTAQGRQMLQDNMLPVRPRDNQQDFYYDPIRQRVLSQIETNCCSSRKPAIAIDCEPFIDVFPDETFVAAIPTLNPSWWRENSRVVKVRPTGETGVFWRESTASLILDGQSLRIAFAQDDYADYVNNLPGDKIWSLFVEPTIPDQEFLNSHCPWPKASTSSKLPANSRWMLMSDFRAAMPAEWHWCLLNFSYRWLDKPPSPAKGQLLVAYDPHRGEDECRVTWSRTGSGCLLTIGKRWPLPSEVLVASDQSVVTGAQCHVKVNEVNHVLPLCLCQQRPVSASVEKQICSALAELSGSLRADIARSEPSGQSQIVDRLVVPAWWEAEKVFLAQTNRVINSAGLSAQQRQEVIKQVENACTAIRRKGKET